MPQVKRILVTGGAGFLGSHLCERLVDAGARRDLPRQLLHQPEDERRPSAGPAELRAGAARRHAADLARSRRDLQPGLPGRARPLPVQSDQDDEDVGAGGDQHAGHGQALPGEDPAGLDQRSLRRPRGASAAGRRIAARSTRSARGPATTKASGRPKRCSWTTTACTTRQHPHRADLQHLRPADASVRRPRRVELHPPGARAARTSRSSATAARPARSATATIWSKA